MNNDELDQDVDTKIPWHFWLFVGLAGLYLSFRFIQIIIWGVKAIF